MVDHNESDNTIPAEEIQEVLAELGLKITLQQATEVAQLLQSAGDLDAALAAMDELLQDQDVEMDGFESYSDAA